MAEAKSAWENKALLDLMCHTQSHIEKSYQLLSQYKDSGEAPKKALIENIESLTMLSKNLMTMLTIITARSLGVDLRELNTGNKTVTSR